MRVALVAAMLILSACSVRVAAPPSVDSWEKTTDQTLGSAVSSLGTAEVLLENQAAGRLTRTYVVVSFRDAIELLERDTVTFLTVQPPAAVVELHRRAVTLVQDAAEVLDAAADSAAAADAGERAGALDDVRSARKEVQDFQDALPGALR